MKGVKNMKKQYVKPELYFEDFELSANIATGCEAPTNHTKDQCAYSVGGENVFVEGVTNCTTKPEGEQWGDLCYHNPSENNKLFTS